MSTEWVRNGTRFSCDDAVESLPVIMKELKLVASKFVEQRSVPLTSYFGNKHWHILQHTVM
jgi:hypothetical protein